MVKESVRALLSGVIDYAGLFPPAKLDLASAVRNYEQYRAGEFAWMLGRFVLPAALARPEFPVTVVAGADVAPNPSWDVIEWKRGRTPAPMAGVVQYFERAALDGIAAAGARAKIRTGGDTIPTASALSSFVENCAALRVAFKATAGLHHPFPAADMHGFVNLFLFASFLWHGTRLPDLLTERDPQSFELQEGGVAWRGRELSARQIFDARREFCIGFGSCSFEEPIEDLQRLKWL